MKITFLGNFDVDYTTESHHKRTYEKLGHEVIALREGKTDAATILAHASKSDMFVYTHTHGWETPDIGMVYKVLRNLGIPSVGYHLDLWLGIGREKDLQSDPYWGIEYFFSVDKLMVDYLNSKENMPKAFFLPPGVVEDECYIGDYDADLAHDIIFVGSRGYHPEWPYRPQLIEWLERTYGNRFAQYGGGGKGTIRGKKLNDLYHSSKIVVGDTLCKGFDYPYYLSDRIFETTGRGGFIIHPYIKGIEEHFKIAEEIVTYTYNKFDELKELIDYYLANDNERQQIQQAGFERTKKTNTYTQRLSKLIETIQNEKK